MVGHVVDNKICELTCQTRAQDTRDLFDQSRGSKEVVILLSKLLDNLLVLVELLQIVNGHLVDTQLLGFLAMLLVSKHANGRIGLRNYRQTESSRETFVAGGVIVLQGDLELDGLLELADLALLFFTLHLDGFSLGEGQHAGDGGR